jgi:general secretion pathway protein K
MVRRAQNGSALIAVFWFVAILSLAVFSTIWVVDADIKSVHQQSLSFRALQLAEMGVAIGANPAVEEYDPILNQFVEGESGLEEGFSVRIRSEAGLMNINRMLTGQDREFRARLRGVGHGIDRCAGGGQLDARLDRRG